MQLKLKRSQRDGGIVSKTAIFCLDARVAVTPAEQASISRYKLANLVIYNSEASKRHLDRGDANLGQGVGGNLKAIASFAMAAMKLFWTLQREAVEAKRQAYLEDGWAGVELIEPGRFFQPWEHEKRGKSRGGRVYVVLSARGEVEMHEGWLPRREASRQERSETGAKADRPEVTSALRTYLDLHRHAAVRARLLDQPGFAFRLMIAHASTNAGLWNVGVDPQRSDKPATAESVETSAAEALFDEKRRAAIALLGLDAEALSLVGAGRRAGTMELFQQLAGLSDGEVLAIAALVMGETLEAGSSIVDGLGTVLAVEMTGLWQADEAFFDLIRDKQVLASLVAEVAGPEAASANAGETGKVLKSIVRDCLAGENGRKKVENWVPRWLLFPASNYKAPPASETDVKEAVEEAESEREAA